MRLGCSVTLRVSHPVHHYVRITDNLRSRLHSHNLGPCGYTVSYRPGLSWCPWSPHRTRCTTLRALSQVRLWPRKRHFALTSDD